MALRGGAFWSHHIQGFFLASARTSVSMADAGFRVARRKKELQTMRGGSWYNTVAFGRAARRGSGCGLYLGFRISKRKR